MSSRIVPFPAAPTPSGAGGPLVGREVGVVHAGRAPVLALGRVASADGDLLHVTLDEAAPFPEGGRAVLEMSDGTGAPARHLATIVGCDGRALSVRLTDARPPDRREYPRLRGEVHLRWRVGTDAADRAAWLRGDDVPGPFHAPRPFMEFSATGLAFEDAAPVERGDLLLLEVALPVADRAWRCLGTVIRVGASGEAAREVAVRLDHVPRAATVALARYTLEVQEAALAALLGDEADPR
ncbi:MAG: hypothetical protein ACK4YP_19705 [Myxococcota bacterium]